MSSRQQQKRFQQPPQTNKLFYRIGEVSEITGLEPYVLRYWETEFPHLRPERRNSGQRLYTSKDLENIQQVQRLLHREGYTISGAKKRIRQRSSQNLEEVVENAKREIRGILELLK